MKVLLLTQAFPPFSTSGAVRVGKLASYLLGRDHDVRVITAAPLPYPRTLRIAVPAGCVVVTRSADPIVMLQSMRSSAARTVAPTNAGAAARPGLGRRLIALAAPFAIPEPQVGWYPYAVAAGRRLMREWKPDVIYASALPFTAHMVAASLSRATGAPWVAEFRDHFAENPYSNLPAWRAPVDRWLEHRVVSSAAACVTISEPMAETLRARHGKPTLVVLNGYDDNDRPPLVRPDDGNALLRIVYTGVIYPGRRDPSPLFEAIKSLGALAERIEVTFFGQDLRRVAEAAAAHGVGANVKLRGAVPYQDSLAAQQHADVLLLLLWNDPREVGVFTGKLFEYIGAGRPVLAVGATAGVAAELIRSRGLGITASDPAEIAAALRRWLEQKDSTGLIPATPESARAGLSRAEQFARVDSLLRELAAGTAPTSSSEARGTPETAVESGWQR